MNYQTAIITAAVAQGKDPTELNESEYRALSIQVRTPDALRRDVLRASTARIKSWVRVGVVSGKVKSVNLKICRANPCGSYGRLQGRIEVCHRCNCTGKNLNSKTEQRTEHCPAINPETGEYYWDNRTEGTDAA